MLFPIFKENGWTALGGSSVNYVALSIGFLLTEQAFEFYLMFRQRKCLQKDAPPAELLAEAATVDEAEKNENKTFRGAIEDKFSSSKEYNLDRSFFSFVKGTYSLLFSLGSLMIGLGPLTLTLSKSILSSVMPSYVNEYSITATLILISSLVDTVISLPLSYYSTFVLEEKHGFNKTTLSLFISDLIKQFCISTVIQIPVFLIIIRLIQYAGEYFYFYVWLFLIVFSLIMLSIYPNYIMPLFNKYESLKNKELRDKISDLANELDYPLTKIYQVDGSKRSSHSNAYLYGFFKDKRIVLFDTLFTKQTEDNEEKLDLTCSDEEIIGILAHELGHWKYSHTLKGFVLQQSVFFVILRLFSEFINNQYLYNQFGYVKLSDTNQYPVIVGLNLFSMLLTPLNSVLSLFANMLSRKYEYEADEFAVSLGKTSELKTGLLKISISNLSSFEVDPYYHMFTHSHPTLLQRLQRMNILDKKYN